MQAFGEGMPVIGWDEEGAYTRARVRPFYCSHCGTVLREAQITETLQGRFPSGYVETGCQVRTGPALAAPAATPRFPLFHAALRCPLCVSARCAST